jgi:hypothetical protein
MTRWQPAALSNTIDLADVTTRLPVDDDPLVPMVFHNRWWLDAATGGDYEEAEVRINGAVVARLPYVVDREWPGQCICTMPQLTHSLGWAVDLGCGSVASQNRRHAEITRELTARLRSFAGFHHKLSGRISDTFAFNEAGYTTTVQFTFEIAAQPHDVTWRGMRDKTRNVIRRAGEQYEVASSIAPASFSALYDRNLRARGLVNTTTRMTQVTAAALAHDSGRIYAARDSDGTIAAAVFIVWDMHTAYYLLATRSPGSANGAVALLIWHAIRDAHARGLTFDFDGVGTRGSRLFFTGFGGVVTPRFIVSRFTRGCRIAQMCRNSFARSLGRLRQGTNQAASD